LPNAPTFNLVEWRHLSAMGRDQYVRVANRGYLFPLGHRALLVQVVERKLESAPNGQRADYLMRRTFVVVQEPVKEYTTPAVIAGYTAQGREMPFKQVRITTLVTPALDHLLTPPDFPFVGGAPFRFHVVAEDCDGQVVDFSLPLMFVFPATDSAAIQQRYADPGNRQADLRNQTVAYARSVQPGDTHLKTATISFQAQMDVGSLDPPFLPTLEGAAVSIPAVDHLLGSSGVSGATTIGYHDVYLRSEFDQAANPSQAFARLASGLPLPIPADKAGGLATPNLHVDGLSRSLGPVAQVDSLVSGNLQQIIDALDGNLLGVISLKQVISAVTSGPIEAQIPRLLTTQLPDAVETSFEWHPEVEPNVDAQGNPRGQGPPPPLVTTRDPNDPSKSTHLDIAAHTRTPLDGSDSTFSVDGTLSYIGLSFFGIVLVTFDQLRFHAERGKKVELHPQGVHVEFIGALSFVNQLAELLPADGFSDPPVLQVTPEGITAGYTLGIPAAGVGAFSLENIALSAQLSLPFVDDRPANLRLAFSERFHPFLVTVSLVGGGGFLAVGVSTRGIDTVEGSLELGGNITISLGIVEANAHVMMGVHFGLLPGAQGGVELDFSAYIRIGAEVDLLGLVGVSIDMYLGLTFTPKIAMPNPPPGILGVVGGVASLTVGVHLLFVDKSFTLTFERNFVIPARADLPLVGSVSLPILSDPGFDEMVSEDDWQTYCQAFA
jgi:hypothetical protein